MRLFRKDEFINYMYTVCLLYLLSALTLSLFIVHRMDCADCREMNTSFPQNVSLHKAFRKGFEVCVF